MQASIERCLTVPGAHGGFGGVASYRISKAALNMAMRCFAGELCDKGFIFASVNPGHVATDMGSTKGRKPPLTVEQSVSGILQTVSHLAPNDNGKFLAYDGTDMPF